MTDFFLPRRHDWMFRAMFSGLPVRPTNSDLGPVKDALAEIVDAAGGLEHSRAQLARVVPSTTPSDGPSFWAGRNTPSVYCEFANAVAWARAVDDRYGSDRLRPAVQPNDPDLWKELQQFRSVIAGPQFEDARQLAKVTLHKFTLPYSGASAKVDSGKLVYPVPRIIDPDEFRRNRMEAGRHVTSVVDELWAAVERFVDQLLDVFYPRD